MASIIPFFILLLITYSYSAPIVKEYGTSTTTDDFTSSKTMVEREDKVKVQLFSDDESTSEPTIRKERSSEESNSQEITTGVIPRLSTKINEKRGIEDWPFSSSTEINEKRGIEDWSFSSSTELNEKRGIKDWPFPTSTELNDKHDIEDWSVSSSTELNEKRGFEDFSFPSTTELNEKRGFEDFSWSTMESSTEFNRRAIRPVETDEEVETSTYFLSKNQREVTTKVEPLSSSVDSFGKFTGLLHDDEKEEHSSTFEYETTDRPIIKSEKLVKTVAVIPGKITETKIFVNDPKKKSIVMPPEDEKPNCLNNRC